MAPVKHLWSLGLPLSQLKTGQADLSYNRSPDQGWLLVPTEQRRKKMHKPVRHIEDPITSVITLLVWGALGFFGLLVLMFALALGF